MKDIDRAYPDRVSLIVAKISAIKEKAHVLYSDNKKIVLRVRSYLSKAPTCEKTNLLQRRDLN